MKTASLNSRSRFNGVISAVIIGLAAQLSLYAAETNFLWQIGKRDNENREFALAPNRYSQFQEDGFFVAGRSDAKRDWPYVHPGPVDGWAGGRSHTFSIIFGVQSAPTAGQCKLVLDLVDTHSRSAPDLKIEINGQAFKRKLPDGAGDDSVFGQPAKGKEHVLEVAFPADLLRKGGNTIDITTLSGSWILYDWIGLQTPAGAQLADASGTFVSSLRSPPVLVEKDGQLLQTIQLTLKHAGDEAEAVVKLDDQEAARTKLRTGEQKLELPVPAVEKEKIVSISVEVAGKKLALQGSSQTFTALTLKPVRKWVVYLLPHSHVDIGYTHVQTEVEQAQWKYLEMAMDTARKTAGNRPGERFKWNVEVLWAVDSYLRQATPEKQQQFIEAVRAGQVGLQALYGNELTGLCRPEELLRLLSYAQSLSQRCGVPIESAMITDVPGYTWGMVPAFAHSGVKYFSIGPNGGDRIGHTIAAWGDKPFWWIGPNGRDRVLVWMTGTGYYQVFQSPEKLNDYLRRLEDKGYPYDMVQVRHCLGDNGAPDVNFADKVKAWNATHAYPKLVIATSEEMFHDFEKRYGSQIPTAQGDFTPYWEDGAASSARETALNRASADRLTQAETLYAMLKPKQYPAEQFYQAWRNVILYDEHTWGAHNSISQPDAPFVKSQWAIKQAFALDADRQSRQLLEAALAGRGAAPELPPKVNAIDVFNTGMLLDYGLVVVPKELSLGGDAVTVSPTNESNIPSQRLSSGELVFRVCYGPLQASRFYISDRKPYQRSESYRAKAEGNTLTTSQLKVRVDEKTGDIVSLRTSYAELADTSKGALNQYLYLPDSDLKGLKRNGPVKISVKERGPLIASVLIESDAPGCRKLTREVRVHEMRHYVEIIDTVDKAPVRAKEGVHFGFNFNVPNGVVRMDVPWGVVRPETDQIPGACKNWFTVQRWVDIANTNYGATWYTPDAPLVEVGGITANLIGSLPDPRVWMDHIEPSQSVYSWAMNNHWHTNYRAEQEGPTVFRYIIRPHKGGNPDEAWRFGHELSHPLVVTAARGELKRTPSPLSLGFSLSQFPATVMLTAFKPSEDGKAIIVRLYGAAGKTVEVPLNWSDPKPASVWLSDNSEKPLQKIGDKVEVPAYGIVTVRAELP